MQIGNSSSLLNAIGQSLTALPGASPAKANTPAKSARSELSAANEDATKSSSQVQPAAPSANAKRGSYVNLVV